MFYCKTKLHSPIEYVVVAVQPTTTSSCAGITALLTASSPSSASPAEIAISIGWLPLIVAVTTSSVALTIVPVTAVEPSAAAIVIFLCE